MTKQNSAALTDAEIEAGLKAAGDVFANRIRFMLTLGWTYYRIAKYLSKYEREHHGREKDVLTQHVRNTAVQPLKRQQ